jgi:hypothetical protein
MSDKLFRHKVTNDPVDVVISYVGVKPSLNIIYRSKQFVFIIHDPDLFTDFFTGITPEWIHFIIESNTTPLLIDDGNIMDEYLLNLN